QDTAADGSLENQDALADGDVPTVKVVYSDTEKTPGEAQIKPDFIVTKDGTVEVLNDPEQNPHKEIVIEVERDKGQVGPPTEAQQATLAALLPYLKDRIDQDFPAAKDQQLNLDDQQGLVPDSEKQAMDTAPTPEDSLSPPAQQQVQDMNRFGGSSG